jgi:signal transduction histidine kinase
MVAREKAASDAKTEFMSLMCHEVRTPLNGCLASAEMLLETPLLVRGPVHWIAVVLHGWLEQVAACMSAVDHQLLASRCWHVPRPLH